MKLARSLLLGSLVALGMGVNELSQPAIAASQFDQAEVEQSRFVAIASPFAGGSVHRLVILEQIRDTRPCWRESGSSPASVDPLLLNFDFTNICGRNPDSNGYSVRVGGEDLGSRYSLRIRQRGNGLVLLAEPRSRDFGRAIEIGRSYGIADGFTRIDLNPGWRFTKRMYQGQRLGHVYLTNDQSLSALLSAPSRAGISDSWSNRPAPSDSWAGTGDVETSPAPRSPIATRPRTSTRAVEIPVVPPGTEYEYSAPDARMTDPNLSPRPRSGLNRGDLAVLPVPTPPPTPRGERPPGDTSLPPVSVSRPPSSSSYGGTLTDTSYLAAQMGFSYRVVVQASTPEAQAQVRALVPDAFRTIINGQTVIQAGLFRDISSAQELQQTLSNQSLPARVLAVR